MFDIEYRGANAVVFTTKKTQLVFDPRVSVAGGKDVSVKGAIEAVTEDRFAVENTTPKLLLSIPGEYGVGDTSITGVAAQRHIDTEEQGQKSTIYRVVIGDVRIAVLGNIAPKLSDDQLEALGVIDIVVIPVGGGGYTLDPTDAAKLVRQIEPRAVIPVHYADEALNYEVPQQDLDVFVQELGAGVIEAGPIYKIKSISSVPEQLSVVKITRS